ncbi:MULTISPECIES: DUF2177 family protein [unclassified Devosia]|uniref:DUF2177 family protein n=1 Tax=unclassified Devosia TaxID=196773 RepID=UPI00145F93C7|nr:MULTISPECIES: DUF2177 family protein [unclassified Devosia]MBJ6986317.1 DUF2177 family protein [Devosia sp. MC521]MBJ7576429.1 DUF2177 family protein [Devosia sp. MC532]QMW64204.1 DUF2177 family protein [Devosia sp. MC521]
MAGFSIGTLLAAYFGAAALFFAVDFIWLGFLAIGFYRSEIGHLLLDKPNMTAAVVFYLFYVIGIVGFAILPALNANSWVWALVAGVALGLIAYGTYDFTNLATLKDWSWKVTVVDLIWGGAITGGAAVAGYFAARLTV